MVGGACPRHGPPERLANPRSLGRPGFPQRLQRKIGSALIKLEQNGALRRCPPALLPAPRPAARPRAREARQLPHVLLPPALLRRRARRLGGRRAGHRAVLGALQPAGACSPPSPRGAQRDAASVKRACELSLNCDVLCAEEFPVLKYHTLRRSVLSFSSLRAPRAPPRSGGNPAGGSGRTSVH